MGDFKLRMTKKSLLIVGGKEAKKEQDEIRYGIFCFRIIEKMNHHNINF